MNGYTKNKFITTDDKSYDSVDEFANNKNGFNFDSLSTE